VPDSAMPVLVPMRVQNIPSKISHFATSWSLIACCGRTVLFGRAWVSHLTAVKAKTD